jgi:hypothetical protein
MEQLMKKLKLIVEELQVDGFTTAAPEPREGTVMGHFATRFCTAGSCGMICP